MISLGDIIKNSSDSILRTYSYSEGMLTLEIELQEINWDGKIRVKTDDLSFNRFHLEKNEPLYRTCRIEIQNLNEVVSIENGFYVPPKEFIQLMKETRLNYNLAYGKKSTDARYLFSLTGYGKLISCLLSDLNCIALE